MRSLKNIISKIIDANTHIYLLALLAFLLPLPLKENVTSLVTIIIVIFTLYINWKELFNYSRLKTDTFFKLNLIVFLLFIIGTFYSNDFSYSVSQLQKMIPFILFPLLLSSYNYSYPNFSFILKAFVFGVVCYTIVLWIGVYNVYLTDEILNKKMGLNFTLHSFIRKTNVSVHHAYVGMYMTLSIVFGLYLLSKAKKIKHKLIYGIVLGYLLIIFPWLSGKTSIIMLTFTLIMYLLFAQRGKKYYNIVTIPILILLMGVPLLFLDIEWTKTLFKSSIDERIKIYSACYNATLDNLPFGIGNSNTKLELEKYFVINGYDNLVGMATHNTFLSFSLRFGIFGMFFILFYFFFLFKESIRKNNALLLCIFIIVFFSSITEHIFDTHRGRFFTLFFLSLLYYKHQTLEKVEKH